MLDIVSWNKRLSDSFRNRMQRGRLYLYLLNVCQGGHMWTSASVCSSVSWLTSKTTGAAQGIFVTFSVFCYFFPEETSQGPA